MGISSPHHPTPLTGPPAPEMSDTMMYGGSAGIHPNDPNPIESVSEPSLWESYRYVEIQLAESDCTVLLVLEAALLCVWP
jgi:hypothetical protein